MRTKIKVLIVAILIILISTVTAQIEDSTYTQQQVDAMDLNVVDHSFLKCRMERDESRLFGTPPDQNFVVAFSCLTIIKQETGYHVIRVVQLPSISIKDVITCIGENTVAQCVGIYKAYLLTYPAQTVEHIKSTIGSYQTSHSNRVIIENFQDLNYFE